MRIETRLLEGKALNWAVATALGLRLHKDALLDGIKMRGWWISGLNNDPNVWSALVSYRPSANWAQGGPIKEREGIHSGGMEDGRFYASLPPPSTEPGSYGQTELVAAMRCFVVSMLGDEIDMPEDLCA